MREKTELKLNVVSPFQVTTEDPDTHVDEKGADDGRSGVKKTDFPITIELTTCPLYIRIRTCARGGLMSLS